MSEYKPITQVLRNLINTYAALLGMNTSMVTVFIGECDNIDAIHKSLEGKYADLRGFADRVREAAENHEDMTVFSVDYMALPLDADGVPIHVGDWITGRWGAKAKVVAVTSEDVYWWEPDGCHWCRAFEVRHYHEPTVGDVLREFVTEFNRDDTELCDGEIIERYAKRLRLAEVS